jgi:hypothetical protein
MKSLTPQQIVDLNPCEGYDLECIEKLFGNKESVTYLEILNTDKIPLKDIIWLFCQPTVLDKDIRNQWMDIIVTRAVTNYVLHCGIDTVEKWAKNWLSSKDRTDEAACSAGAASYAARYAAYGYTASAAAAAAAYSAIYAAHAAACYVTHAAAYAAYAARNVIYYVATTDAAADAADAYGAARKTEYKQQIEDLKNILVNL